MKKLVLLFAALLVAGCGESQQSAPAPEAKPDEPIAEVPAQPSPPLAEAKPAEPVAEAESPTKSEPTSKAMKANLLKGKWIEFGDTVRGGPETWEFHENGTVDIIDEGKKRAGKYEVTPPDTVSMTVFGMTISAKISKSGDEITSAVGKYKKEGKPDGLLTNWHPNGQKKSEETRKNGKKDGPFTWWHENGQKEAEGTYKDGQPYGLMKAWHYNGEKGYEVTYKDGKLNGRATAWHKNGQKMKEGTYKDGKELSAKYWNSKGEEVETLEESKK